jgi:CRISPR/Cas system CSM-associated protein Csm3 (group 7 of RAMP superfamily)
MLRPLLSELWVEVEIEAKSNLLVKDGRYTQEAKQKWRSEELVTDAQLEHAPHFVFVSRNDIAALQNVVRNPQRTMNSLDYYLPSASVRGAWRSHLEKVLRSLDANPKICDPMATKDSDAARADRACSKRLVGEDRQPEHPYRDSCPVCRVFGSTAHASRLSFSDGKKIAGTAALVDNVAISRQTGSVISPFKSLVLQEAKFSLEMRLRNFELWQVALLAHLFDDLQAKRVPLGSGKNKGFGVVEARAARMMVSYYGNAPAGDALHGLRALVADAKQATEHGLRDEAAVDMSGICTTGEGGSLWRREIEVTNVAEFWSRVKPRFSRSVWEGLPGMAPGAVA